MSFYDYYLACSKISTAIGRNPYEKRDDLIQEIASQRNTTLKHELISKKKTRDNVTTSAVEELSLAPLLKRAKNEDLQTESQLRNLNKNILPMIPNKLVPLKESEKRTTQDIQTLQNEVDDLTAKHHLCTERLESLEQSSSYLDQQIKSAKTIKDRMQLKKRQKDLDRKKSTVVNESIDLSKDLLGVENTKQEAEKKLHALQKEVAKTSSSIEEKVTKITGKTSDVSKLLNLTTDNLGDIQSDINTSIGTVREGKTIVSLGKKGIKVIDNNNESFSHTFDFSGTSLKIIGRIDGKRTGGELVEIKNRRNRFLGITQYDRVQVHSYLFLTKCTRCHFIEDWNGKKRSSYLDWDQDFWDTIVDDLSLFVKEVNSVNGQDESEDSESESERSDISNYASDSDN